MVRDKRWMALAVGALVTGVVLFGHTAPAGATIDGPCEASGSFAAEPGEGSDTNVNATQSRAGIPRAADVTWTASISGADTPRPTLGALFIDTPMDDFFDFISVDTDYETWGDEEDTDTSDGDTDDYSISSFVPGGAEVKLSGFHFDSPQDCSGSIVLFIDESPWSSPTTLIALGLTILFGLLLVFTAMRRRWDQRMPLGAASSLIIGLLFGLFLGLATAGDELALVIAALGAILGLAGALVSARRDANLVAGSPGAGGAFGLLFGLFLAVFLWAVGVFGLDSPMLLWVPAITTALGFGAGMWAPIGSAKPVA